MYTILLPLICATVARATVSPDVQEWHLVRCLQSISHRYFTTGQTLVLSLHEGTFDISRRTYENFTTFGGGSIDIVNYIFKEMHKWESRSVVISNVFTDYVATDWNSNPKPDSYLLLTPSWSNHETDIVQSVKSQLKQLSSYPRWNPRARFVVPVMNISFNYNAEKLSQRILEELWKRKVLNSIVLIQLTNTSQSEDDADTRTRAHGLVMEDPALGIYTWFPYRGPNQCSVVDEAVLLDMWLMAGEGSFVTNSFLFPKKINANFHRCKLRVVIALGYTLVVDTFLEEVLISSLENTMNVTLLEEFTDFFEPIQDESRNYIGYTDLLMNDKADIAVGGIMRTGISTNLVDVTTSYRQIRWEWIVPCPVKIPGWKSVFRIFSLSGWLSILLAAMLAIVVIVFLARFGIKEHESFRRVVDAILDVWALILGVPISSLPRTTPLRLFFSAWLCYSLAIRTVFQADLTTFLVDPGNEKSITSLEEIVTSGTKYGYSSFFLDHYFIDTTDPMSVEILENRIDCDDLVTCLVWAVKYRNISFICSSTFMEFLNYGLVGSDEIKEYQACLLKEMPTLVTDTVMALQKGSPLLDLVNEIIDRLVESGILAYWTQPLPELEHHIKAKSSTSKYVADDYYVLSMNHMQSAFYLLLFGHSLGFITFLVEMMYFKIYVKRH